MVPSDPDVYQQMQLSKVFHRAAKHEFDIIHSHVGHAALPFSRLSHTPVIHTLHYTFTPLIGRMFTQHRQQNFVSISDSQRRPDLGLNYVATVYNAIALDSFTFYPEPDQLPYLAFLGRMSEQKGPHLAIAIAKRSGLPLKMAGKVDFDNREFFDHEVAPHIDGDQIKFLGEADHPSKNELMGRAMATLFPITWREPFGLVMPESMACGTPVIAMNRGAAPEVIADGKTGFLCHSIEDCLAAIAKIPRLSRQTCRAHVRANFSVPRMVDGYEAVYRQVLRDRVSQNRHVPVSKLLVSSRRSA
jgi:glycosyltransferase involved in cell wall biosynthesis